MMKIALTGGIGSGKSVAARYFAALKTPIIDADKIVHQLLKAGTPTYKKIVTHFGKDLLTAQKSLDRKKLASLIFSTPKEKAWLEKLIHPQVKQIMEEKASRLKKPYCILVIPLFFETNFQVKVDRVLLIDCPLQTQIKRLKIRDHNRIKQIKNIVKTQAKRKLRCQKTDDIIYNNSSLNRLKRAVAKMHNYYLNLAKNYASI